MLSAHSRSLRFGRQILAVALVGLSVACSKPTADEHFKKANDYMAQSHVDEAIIEYRNALNVDPKRGDIRTKLGDAYMLKQDIGNAYREYIRAADLLPNDIAAQIKAGDFLLLAKRYEDAETRANNVLKKDQNNVDATILLGNALAGLQKPDEALREYQEAIVLNPTDDRAYASIGALQLSQSRKAEAEAAFRKAVQVAPKSVPALLALAGFLWDSNRAPEAEGTLKSAVALDPTNAGANRALGIFYMASGRTADAEPYFKAIADHSQSTDDTIALADYYVVAKRYEDAKRLLRTLAQKDKSFAIATTRLAAIDALEGNHALARQKTKQVLDKYPKDMSARLLDARILLLDGKRTDALVEASSIVNEEPMSQQSEQAYMLIGALQTSFDSYDEAVKAYKEVLTRNSRPLAAHLALAALYLRMRQFDQALSSIQLAESIQPKNPIARSLRVRVLMTQGKMEEAKTELASLQKDYPTAAPVLVLVGNQQLAEKQYDAARGSFTKALQVAPASIDAAAGLISVDLATGKKADAVARIEAGVKSSTPTSDLMVLAARTYAATGDLAKAEEYLNKAVDIDPARLEAYMLLGQLYVAQKRTPAAIEEYQKIVQKTPNSVPAHTIIGMLYESQHQLPEAEKAYQKALSVDSHAAVAANNLAWIYVASNRNLDEALQLAQIALQQLPDEPHVNDTLGWIYYRKDMAARAVPYLEVSVQKNPTDPTGFYHLGMAYVRNGDVDKGRTALQKAVNFKVEFDGISDARKTLAQVGG
jgi:tetratricopeptide (TPR) repeat protein